MVALGAFLAAAGLADLVRAGKDATSHRRTAAVTVVGVVLLAAILAVGGLRGVAWWTVALPLAASIALWTVGSASALRPGRSSARGAWRAVAFTGLGAGVLVAALLAPAGPVEWPAALVGSLTHVRFDLSVAVLGITLAQVATGNVAVRLVLDAVGVPAATNEKRLRSGRILGPLERVFIVGLGVAGYLTAASVVVAAKGLLRFPEIQGSERDPASPVTEYFLVGSFTSWLFALGSLALTRLA
ncbi:hypothetical protein [Puerhibacterium puerhi]|uniref:hypothetical protein n=1 Tax=Puerhibacterium puerhi TaxID=2692623 RepID=UPI00135AFE2F|nr:hypothetical protein [Puerhibacterium puerhi]